MISKGAAAHPHVHEPLELFFTHTLTGAAHPFSGAVIHAVATLFLKGCDHPIQVCVKLVLFPGRQAVKNSGVVCLAVLVLGLLSLLGQADKHNPAVCL